MHECNAHISILSFCSLYTWDITGYILEDLVEGRHLDRI
jgi:hypothetical protein